MKKDRFKNPYFWIGLAGVVFTAMGVSPETFTSWAVVKQQLLRLVGNPFMLGSVSIAVVGVFVNPNTKGLGD